MGPTTYVEPARAISAPTSYVPGPTSYVRDGAPTTYVAPTTYARDIAIPSTRYVSAPTTYVEPRSYVRGYSTYGSTPTYAKAERKWATADWMFNDVEELRDELMGKGHYWTDDKKLLD